MALRFDFTLTAPEVGAAYRQLVRRQLWLLGIVRWFLVCVLMGAVLALVGLTTDFTVNLERPALFLFAAALLALPLALATASLRVGRQVAPSFLEPTTVLLAEDHIEVGRVTFAGTGSWQHFQSWKELPSSIVLEHFPGTILILPKRAIAAEGLPVLRELLIRKLGAAKTA